jgi:hypothetical protein
MFRLHGTGFEAGGDLGAGVALDARPREPLRKFGPQAAAAPVQSVAAHALNLPPLSDLPSSLPWGEGERAGSEVRKGILDAIGENVEKALAIMGRAGIPTPDIEASDSVYDLNAKVLAALLDPIGKAADPTDVEFGEDAASVLYTVMPSTFFNCDLDMIEECADISEERKGFLYRLAAFVVRVNDVLYTPREAEFVRERATEYAEEMKGWGEEDSLVPVSEVQDESLEDILAHVALMQEQATRWAPVFEADSDTLEADLLAFDAEPEFRDQALAFLRAARRLGPLQDHILPLEEEEEDGYYSGDAPFASALFYVSPHGENIVNDWYRGQVGGDAQEDGVQEFRTRIMYGEWMNTDKCRRTAEDINTFVDLYALLLCNFGLKTKE